MNFLGKMFSDFTHMVFGGHDGGGSTQPVLTPPPMPPMVSVPDNTPHNAASDGSYETFLAALTASMSGKTGAVLTGGTNASETIKFGNMHTTIGVNPDGSTYSYSQFNSFAELQTNSYTNVAQDTTGGIHYSGDTSWSGYYNPDKVVAGEDVVVQHSYNYSDYDEVTLVGIGHPMPDIFDYGGKG